MNITVSKINLLLKNNKNHIKVGVSDFTLLLNTILFKIKN